MAETLVMASATATAAGLLLALWRFLKGPGFADRIVALDVLTIISITLIALIALVTDRGIYLDVALVYALLSFLGVIAAARYLERGL